MEKNIFFSASVTNILPANKVIAVLDYKGSQAKKFVATQDPRMVRFIQSSNEKRRTVLWMEGNVFYVTNASPQTIAKRISACNVPLIKVATGYFLGTKYITGIADFDCAYATKSRKEKALENNSINLVRGEHKSKLSTIDLLTGAVVNVVDSKKTLAKKINSFNDEV